MGEPRTVSLTRVRLVARAPRWALYVTAGVLTMGGLVRTFSAPTRTTVTRPTTAHADTVRARGFAERFAWTFLTLIPGHESQRAAALAAFGLREVTGPMAFGSRPRRVHATSVADIVVRGRTTVVTVGTFDGARWTYLAVPVVQTSAGALAVVVPPAIVGPMPVARVAIPAPATEVADATLRATADRVVRHYVAADATDLVPDLASPTARALPAGVLRVTRVNAVTWVTNGRAVAVDVQVRDPSGTQLSLRYELTVVRIDGRWLVRDIVVPEPQEQP